MMIYQNKTNYINFTTYYFIENVQQNTSTNLVRILYEFSYNKFHFIPY